MEILKKNQLWIELTAKVDAMTDADKEARIEELYAKPHVTEEEIEEAVLILAGGGVRPENISG